MNHSPLTALHDGAIVIVPNQRAEQYWSLAWMQQEKKSALPGNRLYSFSRWLQALWALEPQSFSYQLLSDKAAQTWWALELWRHYHIQKSSNYMALAYSAYQRCARFMMFPDDLSMWPLNGQQQQFLQDWELCLEQKKRQFVLFQDDLLALVTRAGSLTELKGKRVVFYDLETSDPATAAFMAALEKNGVFVERAHTTKTLHARGQRQSFFYADKEQELQAALHWLQQQPLALRSAVIVPDMSGDFPLIKAHLHANYEGDHALFPLEQQRSWLAISSGTPLVKHPLIAQLLAALKGAPCDGGGTISQDHWLSYHQILPPRALWDAHLIALQQGLHHRRWLLDTTLSSEEYQATKAFYLSLEALIGLWPHSPPMSPREFLHFFELSLTQTLFQPQSLTDKKMILGLLEAAALPWDAVWIFQGHSKNFPPPLSPHSLLPYEWQVQHQLPQASVEKEWAYFKGLLEKLLQRTSDIYISSSGLLPQDWAPLWRLFNFPVPEHNRPPLKKQGDQKFLRNEIFHPQRVHSPSRTLSVSQFNYFTHCPFKGFAYNLPEAQPQKPMHPMFDPRVIGKITHLFIQHELQQQSLENSAPELFQFWPDVLKEYTVAQLSAASAQLSTKLPNVVLSEKLFVEKSFEFKIGQFLMTGRADLISSSGRVIDIKTATPILSHWFHETPLDWQGALYALALKTPLLGILVVSTGTVSYWEREVAQWLPSWEKGVIGYLALWEQGEYHPNPRALSYCTHCLLKDACRYHLQELV